jgi:hypothetical protein
MQNAFMVDWGAHSVLNIAISFRPAALSVQQLKYPARFSRATDSGFGEI